MKKAFATILAVAVFSACNGTGGYCPESDFEVNINEGAGVGGAGVSWGNIVSLT